MVDPRKKLDALILFGSRVGSHPEMAYLLGFLAGRLDRLHFVRSLEGAPVAVRLAAGRRRLWPGSPFEATVRGVPVPAPGLFVAALCDSDDDICVQIELDDLAELVWFRDLLVDAYADLRGGPQRRLDESIDQVRGRIDDALDIYRECRRVLEDEPGEREGHLRFFLKMAESEIEGLSRQLTTLNQQLTERKAES